MLARSAWRSLSDRPVSSADQGGSGADVIRGNGGADALYGGTPSQDTGDAICTLDDGPDQLFGRTR
jgi:Ca2+-binding RTX toxin-like protein